MDYIISGEMEDKIFAAKAFNNELQKVQEERFEKLYKSFSASYQEQITKQVLKDESFKDIDYEQHLENLEKLNDYLFDYVYNESEQIDFEEYLYKYIKDPKCLLGPVYKEPKNEQE